MEAISIFDIFKIAVGPSSSHTLGPWKAALDFIAELDETDFDTILVDLYGSLSKTGKGHCTDLAVVLGLMAYQADSIDTKSIGSIIDALKRSNIMQVNGRSIKFSLEKDIRFNQETKAGHPNTIIFSAYSNSNLVKQVCYFSVGGGFIEKEGEQVTSAKKINLPYPIQNAADLENHCNRLNCTISDVVIKNELSLKTRVELNQELDRIINTMLECVYRGCTTEGILPGGLNVKRRAKALANELLKDAVAKNQEDWFELIKNSNRDFNSVNKWVSCFALAVNEENADLGRVVTSPTNGAAGVIPAVMLYYYLFSEDVDYDHLRKFLLCCGEIGCIFKKGATISAAVGGCQAEIGVSSSMAAAGLTELLGGTPHQALMAAEIAMEHHLGMTCDPIAGLVQIPCIERNAMGAHKAITAANLAISGNPQDAKIDLDVVVKAMWETAQEMNVKYKETSEGGLAIHLPVIYPEC